MHYSTEIKLTSAEIAVLWRTFISDTLSICVLTITGIFNKEGYPIYLARIGLNYHSIALPQMARQDVMDFLTGCIQASTELTRRLIKIKLEKGVFQRSPMIEIPDKIDFVDNRNFTAGFFGEKRSLTTGEVADLFNNIQANLICKALFTGFAQVTDSQQIRDYLRRGIQIANKHVEIFCSTLNQEDIPVALPSDSLVMDSTETPFSNKLIMFKASLMGTTSIENYAIAASTSMRHDIQADFVRLGAEVAKYGMEGINILIDNRWLEQPPQAINHAQLAKA